MKTTRQKIVHIITKLELGGAQVNTIYTYEHLDTSNFETYLISGPGGILTDKISKKDNLIIIDSLIRSINPIKDFKTFLELKRILKTIKPQIVHTHSSKAGILGRLAAAAAHVPTIIHSVHGFSFSPFQSFFQRTFYITAEKLIAKLTHHFIFVSSEDMQTAQNLKLIPSAHENSGKNFKFSLIRSGFPIEKFIKTAPDILSIRKSHNIMETDFVCGIIAPFKNQKGLFHLIEIAKRTLEYNFTREEKKLEKKNIIFIIAGDGILRESIETKLNEYGISEHFRLPGFIFDVENVIDTFDLGISTALWEGLPQSLVQLRLKKKAVVASDISGNREIIKHDRNGYLIDVFNYDEFANQIFNLIYDSETRNRLANHNDDLSPWDANFMVRKQEELYSRLTSTEE